MARTYEISFKLGAQMAGNFAKTMSSASGALGQLNERIGGLSKQQSSIQSLVNLRKQVGESAKEYHVARQRVAELGKQLSETKTPTREMTREFEKAQRQASQTKKKLNEKRQSLRELDKSLGTTGQSTRELVRRQSDLAKSAEKARSAQAGLQKTMSAQTANKAKRGEMRGQLFDAVAMGAALAAPIKIAMEFEGQMAKVGAVSKASDQDLARLTKTARELGATTNWSASQAAEGMQFLSMAGFNVDQSIGAMPGMLDLASAGAIDLGKAADIASNVLSGFNMQASEMGRLGDVMTNTFTTSNTDLNMLGETMAYVAPVAASTGQSLEITAAMAGKLGDAGIQGSKAGTALRAMMSRLAAPAGQAATMLQKLGVETVDASGNMRSMPAILADMDQAMQGMGNAARAEFTSTIFGLEAASAASVLLGQAGSGNLDKYAESLKQTGTASRVAQQQNDNAQGSMKRLASAAESIAITMGNVLLPTLAAGAEKFASVIGVVDSLAQNFPLLTSVVVGGTAALIALRVATIAGGYAFTFIKGAWLQGVAVLKTLRIAYLLHTGALAAGTATTKTAMIVSKAMTAAQWLFNAALSANPIALVVIGIAALIAAGVALYKNWDSVTAFFTGAWDRMKSTISSFNPLTWMMGGFSSLINWLTAFSLFESGKKMLGTLAAGIKSYAMVPVNAIKGVLSKVREYLPFSDAKVGPLSELTASGSAIMNTLSKGMEKVNPSTMMRPFAKTAGNMMGGAQGGDGIAGAARRLAGSGASSGDSAGGGMTVQITQHISVDGSGGNVQEQARSGASQGADEMIDKLRAAMTRERRLSYA